MQKLKVVRAIRQGSYDGHRRRAGAEFYVDANANESWFAEVGPAPEGAELPPQLENAQAQRGKKSFIDVMNEHGQPKPPQEGLPQEQTLAEAASQLPVMVPPSADESIV